MDFDFFGQIPPLDEGHVLWEVVEEHLDCASFLWSEWERALESAARGPAAVLRTEDRLASHLHGLALSGAVAPSRLVAAAAAGDEGAAFAATYALLSRGTAPATGAACSLLAARPERRRAVRRAFALAPPRRAPELLRALAGRGDAGARAAALSVAAACRLDPGAALADDLRAADPEVRVAALDAAAALGRRDLGVEVSAAYDAREGPVQAAALRAGLVLASRDALDACRRAATAADAGGEILTLFALAEGDAAVPALIAASSRRPGLDAAAAPRERARREAALFALGFTSSLEAADACAAAVADPDVARVAADSLAAIAGIQLCPSGLASPAPLPGDEAELADDPRACFAPGWDLPVPQPAAIQAHWAARRGAFAAAPAGAGALLDALARAPMRRRRALATGLALRTRGSAWIDPAAWVRGQLAEIARLREGAPS